MSFRILLFKKGVISMANRKKNKIRSISYYLFSFFFIALFSLGFNNDKNNPYFKEFQNIYLYDSLLLISDISSGIHIYSVSDPSHPKFKKTIYLLGNAGIAMKKDIIFANSYESLLSFKLNKDFSYDTLSVIKNSPYYNGLYEEPRIYNSGGFSCGSSPVVSGSVDECSNGTGGSYALFAVIDSFLYYIDNSSLITLDISKNDTLIKLSETYLDWNIETLFPTEKYLYVGGRAGMYILDRTDPIYPKKIGTLQHFTAYDPVVVNNDIAYVTLRAGNWGGDAKDVLLIVNVENPTNSFVIDEISTFTPYGLSIQDTLLYVSNGSNGFSLYTVSDPNNISRLAYWNSPSTKDFIWKGNILYTMAFKNIIIYDVEIPTSPEILSTIQ